MAGMEDRACAAATCSDGPCNPFVGSGGDGRAATGAGSGVFIEFEINDCMTSSARTVLAAAGLQQDFSHFGKQSGLHETPQVFAILGTC